MPVRIPAKQAAVLSTLPYLHTSTHVALWCIGIVKRNKYKRFKKSLFVFVSLTARTRKRHGLFFRQTDENKQIEMMERQMKRVKNTRSLKAQLQKSAYQAHGSGKTRGQRIGKMELFNDYLKRNNIQIKTIDQIKAKYVEGYIKERLALGKNLRTLQNDMSAIRKTLEQAGRDKLAQSPRISNKALGLSGASRKGTKVAITDSQYKEVYQKALLKNPSLAAVVELARVFGLRGEEAVQSVQSLKTWQTAIENGNIKIRVIYGTKGGRPRETMILNRERARNSVNIAIHIAQQQNGRLINKPNLKEAMAYWRNHTSVIGLKGQLSPHSLRYAFAQDAIAYYQSQGFTKQEALAQTSMDLGHGDLRGRYIDQVYCVQKFT